MSPTIQFPVYVRALDDRSFRKFRDDEELRWCEKYDIDDLLYEVWDSTGARLRIGWEGTLERGRPTLTLQTSDDSHQFNMAVDEYVRLCRGDGIWMREGVENEPFYQIVNPRVLKGFAEKLGGLTGPPS